MRRPLLLLLSSAILVGCASRPSNRSAVASFPQPPALDAISIAGHEAHNGSVVLDPPTDRGKISAKDALDTAWARFPRSQVDTEQAILANFNNPLSGDKRLVYVVQYEGVCIPVTADNQPDSGQCALTNNQFNVLIDANTGEYVMAFTDR